MQFARNDIPKYNMNQFFLSGSTPLPFQGNWSAILYSAIREPLRRFSNCPRSYMTVYVHSLAIPDIHCKLFKNKFSSEMISRKNWENFGVGTYNLPRNVYHLGQTYIHTEYRPIAQLYSYCLFSSFDFSSSSLLNFYSNILKVRIRVYE